MSSLTAICIFTSHNLFISPNLPFLVSFLFPFNQSATLCSSLSILSIPRTSIISIASMASSSSRKRRERTPSPFKGEDSSSSAQSGSHEVTGCPALPLRDPWYTPSLFFPQVSHGEAPPSTHAWVFSRQAGFVGSAQVPDPREIFDLQIRGDFKRRFPFFSILSLGKSKASPFGWIKSFLTRSSWVV